MNTKKTQTKQKKLLKPVITDPQVWQSLEALKQEMWGSDTDSETSARLWLRYLSVSDAMKPYRPPRLKVDV